MRRLVQLVLEGVPRGAAAPADRFSRVQSTSRLDDAAGDASAGVAQRLAEVVGQLADDDGLAEEVGVAAVAEGPGGVRDAPCAGRHLALPRGAAGNGHLVADVEGPALYRGAYGAS